MKNYTSQSLIITALLAATMGACKPLEESGSDEQFFDLTHTQRDLDHLNNQMAKKQKDLNDSRARHEQNSQLEADCRQKWDEAARERGAFALSYGFDLPAPHQRQQCLRYSRTVQYEGRRQTQLTKELADLNARYEAKLPKVMANKAKGFERQIRASSHKLAQLQEQMAKNRSTFSAWQCETKLDPFSSWSRDPKLSIYEMRKKVGNCQRLEAEFQVKVRQIEQTQQQLMNLQVSLNQAITGSQSTPSQSVVAPAAGNKCHDFLVSFQGGEYAPVFEDQYVGNANKVGIPNGASVYLRQTFNHKNGVTVLKVKALSSDTSYRGKEFFMRKEHLKENCL